MLTPIKYQTLETRSLSILATAWRILTMVLQLHLLNLLGNLSASSRLVARIGMQRLVILNLMILSES